MNPTTPIHRQTLLQNFKTFYQAPDKAGSELLERLYTQDVEFHDPESNLQGILALKQKLRRVKMFTRRSSMQFLDEVVTEDSATLTWQANIHHPLVPRGETVTVRGITQLRFTERIYYHEDFYDLGTTVYQRVPLLGPLIRLLSRYSRA
ncbi:MAG: nuclear transport factor 2 family protein [Pseudomonadales bacterium]|nr:nuclear transport factor 2 family protein [Pseudomonadales bacterium]